MSSLVPWCPNPLCGKKDVNINAIFSDIKDLNRNNGMKNALKIKADYYSLSIVAPYYGTKMYFDLIDDGVQLDKKT